MMEDHILDPKTTNSVRKVVKTLDDYLWNVTNNVVCSVCHEIFTDPITIPCSHSFCSSCLKTILSGVYGTNKTCPLCRSSINRREANNNYLLGDISKVCHDLVSAFKLDVTDFAPVLNEVSECLMNYRMGGVHSDVNKEKNNENMKKHRKKHKKTSKDKVLSPCVNGVSGEETNSRSEEYFDLKSVSQIELKPQLYVAESPEIEKRLRAVKRVPSKQKVNDWLEKVGKISSASFSTDNLESQDESLIEGTENTNLRRSVKCIDFGNSERTNNVKTMESDPYEFIASQKPYGMKNKKKVIRRKKKTLPGFQAIQNFTKDNAKKYVSRTTDLFDSVCDDNLRKTHRTYSRKSGKTVTMGEKTQEMLLRDYGGIMSDSEESKESEIIPRGEKILPLCPDIDSDSSVDKNVKKVKLDSSVVITDSEPNSKKKSKEKTTKRKKMKTIQGRNSQCAGWTEASHTKKNIETAEKSGKPRRKSLDISGGEPSLNSSKKSIPEQSPKDNSVANNTEQEKELSRNSDDLIGFEKPGSEEKKKTFKLMVEKMEEDLKFSDAKELIEENSTVTKENVTVSPLKEMVHRTPKNKIVPFALLGKIKRKKKYSILFWKLGRLSPNFRRSRSTFVKLVFPKTVHKHRKVGRVAVETQTDSISQNKLSKDPEIVEHEKFLWTEGKKVNVETQTIESSVRSDSKGTQTSPQAEQKRMTPQMVKDDSNSRVDKVFNVSLLKSQTNRSQDFFLDSELESEFNKTWITQDNTAQKNVKSVSLGEKEPDNAVIDLVSSDTGVLRQRVVDNINLDLARAKAASHSSFEQPQQCEESDSDIFIEQTPPKNNSKNCSGLFKAIEELPLTGNETSCTSGESFMVLSERQGKISEFVKRSKAYRENNSPQQKEKLFPKSVNKERDENDRNEINIKSSHKISRNENVRNRRICIVSSAIINRENIEKFVNKFKVEHLSSPRKDMTHLVVGLHKSDDDELVPYCTPKFLYAVANKKWVVTEAWVENCLKSNAIVAEEPYESVDPTGGNGCSVARLSTDLVLKNCEVYLLGEYESITKEEFSALITDCGGTVVHQPSEFTFSSGRIRMILIDENEVQENAKMRDLMNKYSTLVMSRDVIILSMQCYKIANFTPFIMQNTSYEEMIKWGYPPHLVQFDCENEMNVEDSD